jgi:transposase
MTTLVDDLVPDELWALVEPLLPTPTAALQRPASCDSRPQLLRRDCVHGADLDPVAAVARSGAWLRFTDDLLASADRVGQGGLSQRARQAWGDVGANPVDRGKPGSKLHLVCDGGGLPLTAVVTAANVNDAMMLQAVLDDVPPVLTPSGQRRHRPGKLHGDKAYDSAANRAYLRRRGIRPRIARRGVESSTRLGRQRWKVERSLSWLSCWRRLGMRWDRDSERWFAFVLVACAVVCFNRRSARFRT